MAPKEAEEAVNLVAKIEHIRQLREQAETYDDLDDRIGARHFIDQAERDLGRWIVDHYEDEE